MSGWLWPLGCLSACAAILWRPVREERARRREDRERAKVRRLPLRSRVVDGQTIPSRSLAALCPERDNLGKERTVR